MSLTPKLEENRWYRFSKVVYIFCYLIAVGFVAKMAYKEKPFTVIDDYRTQIVCFNGKRHLAGTYDIQIQSNPFWIDVDYLSEGDHQKARELCGAERLEKFSKFDFTPEAIQRRKISKEKNYSVELAYATQSSWWNVLKILAFGLCLVWLGFEIIRRTFFYVVLGRPFW